MKVALVDEDKSGGTCLHRGCIPTKALLESADFAHRVTTRSRELGVTRWAKSADSRSALVGMHPRWRQVPPILSSSTRATFMPSCAARKAVSYTHLRAHET